MDHFNFSSFHFDLKQFQNFSLSDLLGDKDGLHMPSGEKNAKIFAYAVAIFMSFFGNLLLIIVIASTKSLRTKFNYYILNLAVANILVPLTCMWLHLMHDFNRAQWTLGPFFCRIHTFSQVFAVSVGILTLLVTIVDRFLAAEHPSLLWLTQGKQPLVLAITWISGALLALPWLLYTRLVEFDWIGGHERSCQAKFPSMTSEKAYITVFFVVGYAIPIWVMCVCIVLSMGKSKKKGDSKTVLHTSVVTMKRRAVNMLLAVLIVFFICWTPQQCLKLWDVYRTRNEHTQLPPWIEGYTFAAFYLAYFSTCCHPIIYMCFNKCFRHAAIALLRCRRNKFTPTTVYPGLSSDIPLNDLESSSSSEPEQSPTSGPSDPEQQAEQSQPNTGHRYSFSDIHLIQSCYKEDERKSAE